MKMRGTAICLGMVVSLLGGAAFAQGKPAQSSGPNDLLGILTQKPAQQLPKTNQFPPIPAPPLHLAQASSEKGAFLFYSFVPRSPIYWNNFSPKSVIRQAKWLGLKYLEIRLGYSNWLQIAPGAQQSWFNQILDLARSHGIRIIGWVVPFTNNSSSSTIENSLNGDWQVVSDLVHYRTPTGAHLSGIAMDLELGSLYFGGNTTALTQYVQGVRSLVGPGYPLISIVPDPARTGLTASGSGTTYYPYNKVAMVSNVLQPMAYWHEYYASDEFIYSTSYVQNFIENAIRSTRQQAQNNVIPINLALQTFGNRIVGYPSVNEVSTALTVANNYGAVGISAFQWNTLASYSMILAQYHWRR